VTAPRTNPRPLEPWALELLRQEQAGDDPRTQQELAQLVALLRSLPEPEPTPDLARRILDRVAKWESRPRVVRALFGATRVATEPGVAAAIAAGIAAVVALALSSESVPGIFAVETATPIAASEPAAASPTLPPRRPTVLVRPQFVSAFAQTAAAAPRVRYYGAPTIDEAFEARLDRQLNQLMIDPTAFAMRLELVAQRDEFIARLARRAAERGDAPEIALRVRESPHPLATQIVDRLLRATLVASVSPR
jgi:hypothetical protein